MSSKHATAGSALSLISKQRTFVPALARSVSICKLIVSIPLGVLISSSRTLTVAPVLIASDGTLFPITRMSVVIRLEKGALLL